MSYSKCFTKLKCYSFKSTDGSCSRNRRLHRRHGLRPDPLRCRQPVQPAGKQTQVGQQNQADQQPGRSRRHQSKHREDELGQQQRRRKPRYRPPRRSNQFDRFQQPVDVSGRRTDDASDCRRPRQQQQRRPTRQQLDDEHRRVRQHEVRTVDDESTV